VKSVDTFDRPIGKKRKEKLSHRVKKIPKDTYIQVPGTVVAAATATISDRRITSGPLPRIVILLLHPPARRKSAISYYKYSQSEGTVLIASLGRPPVQSAVNCA